MICATVCDSFRKQQAWSKVSDRAEVKPPQDSPVHLFRTPSLSLMIRPSLSLHAVVQNLKSFLELFTVW